MHLKNEEKKVFQWYKYALYKFIERENICENKRWVPIATVMN